MATCWNRMERAIIRDVSIETGYPEDTIANIFKAWGFTHTDPFKPVDINELADCVISEMENN